MEKKELLYNHVSHIDPRFTLILGVIVMILIIVIAVKESNKEK